MPGCAVSTVPDAFGLNYRIAVAEEGCFDRSQVATPRRPCWGKRTKCRVCQCPPADRICR